MDRAIQYDEGPARSYDFMHNSKSFDLARGYQMQDVLGSSTTVIDNGGLAATAAIPASLTIGIGAGRIYQLAELDTTAYGPLPADTTETLMQGYAIAQSVALTTSGLSAGQSRWALIWAQFSQVDVIPGDDPTGGLLNYLNTTDPSGPPWSGPNNDNVAQNTRRTGVCTIGVTYGSVATTGSETPPSAPGGAVGMYLVDLIFGQSQVTQGEILTAGPSVGNNVPNNYPTAPFLAGLLNSHHGGTTFGAGQAPQILMRELANASSARSGAGVGAVYAYAGNPNGNVAGTAAAAGVSPPDFCVDTVHGQYYFCSVSGNAAAAVWTIVGSSTVAFAGTAPSTGSANAQVVAATVPTGFSLTAGYSVTIIPGFTNTGATQINIDSTGLITVQKNSGGSLVALTGSEITINQPATFVYNGTVWVLQTGTLGALAYLGIGNFLAAQSGNLQNTLPEGQCRLNYTNATTLTLTPINGGALWINGFNYPIPASLTVSNSGLGNSTLYYIYAYMNSGTMTLEAVVTGHTTNANGIPQKTGDASRTLVGMAYTSSGGQFQAAPLTLSWFGRAQISTTAAVTTTNFQVSQTTLGEMSSQNRISFLTWADRPVQWGYLAVPGFYGSGGNYGCDIAAVIDGSGVPYSSSASNPVAVSGALLTITGNGFISLSEGQHLATLWGDVNAGSGNLIQFNASGGLNDGGALANTITVWG